MERERVTAKELSISEQYRLAKSPVVASFLEWMLPGTGLVYVGRIISGILVLVLTVIGTFALMVVGLVHFPQVPFEPPPSYYLLAIGIEIVWLATRVVWAILSVQHLNNTAQP